MKRSMLSLAAALVVTVLTSSMLAAPQAKSSDALKKDVAAFVEEKDYIAAYEQFIAVWLKLPLDQKLQLLDELSTHLESKRFIGMENTADLIIISRVEQMKSYGHGHRLMQDAFIEGGKAGWAIEELLDNPVPELIESMTPESRAKAVYLIKGSIKIYKKGIEDAKAALAPATQPSEGD